MRFRFALCIRTVRKFISWVDRAECEMKKAGLRQAGRGAVVGLTAGASASKSKKVRGTSMAKGTLFLHTNLMFV